MKKLWALSLIEVVIFIAVIGVIASILLQSLHISLNALPQITLEEQASTLAQSRMEILLGQIKFQPFATLSDICNQVSPPPVCPTHPSLTLETFIIPWEEDPRLKQITVRVIGYPAVTLNTLVPPL